MNLEGGMTPSSYILRSHSLQVTGEVHLRVQSTSKTASSAPPSHTLTVKTLLALAVLGGREGGVAVKYMHVHREPTVRL